MSSKNRSRSRRKSNHLKYKTSSYSKRRNKKSHTRSHKRSSISSPNNKKNQPRILQREYPLRYISLFSGIGGFEVGIHKIYPNAICLGFSEVNPNSIKVYKEHFPDHPELGDIRKITEKELKELGKVDLLVGGSPCQNFSNAGDRTGLKGDKSSLLYEFLRIKNIVNPAHFLLENVQMSPTHQKEISDLLDCDPVMINSGIVSYQQRKRLYWCDFDISKLATLPNLSGTINKIILKANDSRLDEVPHKDLTKRSRGSMEKRIKSVLIGKPLPQSGWLKIIRRTDKSMRTILKGDAAYEWIVISGSKIRQIHPIERERLQTFDDDWTSSLPRTARYEVLGDAVTCDVIALIVSQLKY